MSNSSNYREIEKKYLVTDGPSYSRLEKRLVDWYIKQRILPPSQILFAQTTDDYWLAPGRGDFVRLRSSRGRRLSGEASTLKEITVKKQDRGSNLDRLEINVEVDRVLDARAMLKVVLGPQIGQIRKLREVILFDGDVVVSLTEMEGGNLYLEIEGPSVESLKEHDKLLSTMFSLEREQRSLFEIYIQADPVSVDSKGRVELECFKNFVDTSKVEWYEVEDTKDGARIKFFDKNKKLLSLKSK